MLEPCLTIVKERNPARTRLPGAAALYTRRTIILPRPGPMT